MVKTVLITGASKGIGKEIARMFAVEGYNIVINYLTSEIEAISLSSELNSNGYKSIAIKADVSNRVQVEKMINEVNDKFGKIDVLINNAAIAQQKLFCDITELEWNKIFDINVKGIFNCCQCILPQMINQKSGKIINISSIWGITGASCEVHYSATKAAVIGMTKALAKEVGPSNITVNCIAPGVIDTEMNSNIGVDTLNRIKEETPLGEIGKVEDIANMVLFLASDKANFITGQVIGVNGGILI